MDAGKVIMQLRKKKGFSQAQLAKLTSITQASLSHIEAGNKMPHKSTIEKLCVALDMPVQMFYFLTISEEDLPEQSRGKFSRIEKELKDLILDTF